MAENEPRTRSGKDASAGAMTGPADLRGRDSGREGSSPRAEENLRAAGGGKSRRRWIGLGLVIFLAAGLWVGSNELIRRWTMPVLPALPDLAGQPTALVEHLSKCDRAARANPTAETIGELGMAYHGDLFYSEAEQCYGVAGELNDADWRWKYYRALVQEELGAGAPAADAMRSVVRLRPDLPLAWFRLGEAESKCGNFDAAIAAYRRAIETDRAGASRGKQPSADDQPYPIALYASYALANVLMKQEQPQEACRVLEPLGEEHDSFGPTHRLLYAVYEKLGMAEKAREQLARAGQLPPYYPPPDPMIDELCRRSTSSTFLLKQQSLARAHKRQPWEEFLVQRSLEVNPGDPDAVRALTTYFMDEVERPAEALPHLMRYCEIHPDDLLVLLTIAWVLNDTKQQEQALSYFQKAQGLKPTRADECIVLSDTARRLGKLDLCVPYLTKALEMEPQTVRWYDTLAEFLCSQGRTADAQDRYRELLRLRPDDVQALNGAALFFIKAGELDEAEGHLNRARQIMPEFSATYNGLGLLAVQHGQVDEALRHFKKALELRPRFEEARSNLGGLLDNLGRQDEAVAHFEEALRTDPKYVPAHTNLGALLFRCGRVDEAIPHFQKALKLRPGSPELRQDLDIAQRTREKMLQLMADQRALIQSRPTDVTLLNNTAWALATNPNASVRNGREAVELAQRAIRLVDGPLPALLDTLAAAYAEAGRFPEAVNSAEQALALAAEQDNMALADKLRARLKLYQAGSPYRDIRQPVAAKRDERPG